MFGPVFSLELLLGSRRGRLDLLRRCYAGWLALQLGYFFLTYLADAQPRRGHAPTDLAAFGRFVNAYLEVFVAQHFLLLALVTPAFAAGAITDEKARRTLADLLAADLTSAEIVLGKWLGRLAQVAVLALAGLPILALMGGLGQLGAATLLFLVVLSGVFTAGLAAVSVFASVRSTQTRDAVLRVYAWAAAGGLLAWGLHEWVGSAYVRVTLAATYPAVRAALVTLDGAVQCLNPVHVLRPAWAAAGAEAVAARLAQATAAWGLIGAGSLAGAAWRLRPAYRRQLESAGRRRRLPVLGWRRPVTDDPIGWKELEVGGLMPLPGVRRLLRGLGCAAAFGWSAYLTVLQVSAGYVVLTVGDLAIPFLITLIAGVRSSGTVSGERERQTWDALLLTPLETDEIIRGKFRGVMRATVPYLVAYAVPGLAISLFSLPGSSGKMYVLGWKVYVLVTAGAVAYFLGGMGAWWSVRSSGSWRSLLATVTTGYGYASLIYFAVVIASGFLGFAVAAFAFIVSVLVPGSRDVMGFLHFLVTISAFTLVTAWAYWKAGESYLRDATRWVGQRERIGNSLLMRASRAIRQRVQQELEAAGRRGAPPG